MGLQDGALQQMPQTYVTDDRPRGELAAAAKSLNGSDHQVGLDEEIDDKGYDRRRSLEYRGYPETDLCVLSNQW